VIDGQNPGVDSRDEGKHTGRNDLLFAEKMMWMDERDQRRRASAARRLNCDEVMQIIMKVGWL